MIYVNKELMEEFCNSIPYDDPVEDKKWFTSIIECTKCNYIYTTINNFPLNCPKCNEHVDIKILKREE